MASELLETARSGVQGLDLSDAIKATTLTNLETWLTSEEFAEYLPQLSFVIESKRWDFLVDCFYQLLPFGTGGRRGTVGIGTNRFNDYTLTSSIQGHVEYLKRQKGSDGLGFSQRGGGIRCAPVSRHHWKLQR